jgi:hypothetical protein
MRNYEYHVQCVFMHVRTLCLYAPSCRTDPSLLTEQTHNYSHRATCVVVTLYFLLSLPWLLIIYSTVLSVVPPCSSEEHIVSIFAVGEQAKQEVSRIRQKGKPESGGDMLLRNVMFSPNYTAWEPRARCTLSEFVFENGHDLILRQVTTKCAFSEASNETNKLLMKED